jgi:hypothetical protein
MELDNVNEANIPYVDGNEGTRCLAVERKWKTRI